MTRAKPGNHSFERSNSRYNIGRMLTALQTPQTYEELPAALFMSRRNIHRYCIELRKGDNRRVRIESWRRINDRWHAVLGLGCAPDVKPPKAQLEIERNRKRRKKMKADPEACMKASAYEKKKWALKKAARTPQTWLSALTGGNP